MCLGVKVVAACRRPPCRHKNIAGYIWNNERPLFTLPQVATTTEELHKELSEKKAELSCLQDELSTRDIERASDGSLLSLRSMVLALEKENSDLKV